MKPRVVRAKRLPGDTLEMPVAIAGAGVCGLTAALMLLLANNGFGGNEAMVRERLPESNGLLSAAAGGFIAARTAARQLRG
ncbi:MAG: hypothetical protein ABI633_01505 [Burkholderiales bacterium]